jgi:dTDP-D-glucose 4,6-dehydratase
MSKDFWLEDYDAEDLKLPVQEMYGKCECPERNETPLPDNNPKSVFGVKKPPLCLVPSTAVIHAAMAFKDGAKRYGPYDWREKTVSAMVYLHAAERHQKLYLDGEDIDPISGVHHLGHAIACLSIILDAAEVGNLIDDRPPSAPTGDLLRRLSEQ